MRIGDWARGLLLGTTLDDKLAPPPTIDAPTSPIDVPEAPGRPDGLRLDDPRPREPVPTRLDDPADRARIVHAFANHELLAIETMALALLRFPAADAAFRVGIARTIVEEQRHLGLYRERLRAFGADLGDFPASGYFWRSLADVPTPRAFVARMSLGFEQANLDFATHWAARFREAGDPLTANVLDVVLRDEIGHVRHGAAWFDRWRDGADWWDTWAAELAAPLTPARAKGPIFAVAPRLSAGIPPDVVDRLRVFQRSKGRVPRVFAFHPGAEDDVAGVASPVADAVAADLDVLPMWLGGRDDAVLVARAPDPAFLRRLADAGAELPAFVDAIPTPNAGIEPWAWTPATCARFGRAWDERWRGPWSKAWAAGVLRELAGDPRWTDPADIGVECRSWDAVEPLLGDRPLVLKAPFATAGRDRRRWPCPIDELRPWVAALLARQGAVVVEPWLDRVADLSVQLTVGDDVRVHGVGRFLTDAAGRYEGAVLGRIGAGLDGEVARFLHAGGPRYVEDALHAVAVEVGTRLRDLGFRGPAGVDALVHRQGEALRLKPIVEVNPRLTMGRIALALGRRVRGAGLWLHVGKRDGLAAIAARIDAVGMRADRGLWTHGALATTDLSRARHVGTVVIVAATHAEAVALAATVAPSWSPGGARSTSRSSS
jgi:uncharacterized ferritin-like protein (DUF455 family)